MSESVSAGWREVYESQAVQYPDDPSKTGEGAEGTARPCRHAKAARQTMTANKATPTKRENVAESTEHELGGIEANGTMGEALAPPEGGRVVTKQLDTGDGSVVSVSVRSDNMSWRVLLSPEQAEAVAAEIEAAVGQSE